MALSEVQLSWAFCGECIPWTRCSPCWNTFLVIKKIWEALYLQGNGMRAWTNETMDIYFIMFGRWRPQWSSIYIHSALLALCENLSPIPHYTPCSLLFRLLCATFGCSVVLVRFSPIQCISSPYHVQAWAIKISWATKSSSEGTVKLRCPQCVSSDDIMSELRLDFEWISGGWTMIIMRTPYSIKEQLY